MAHLCVSTEHSELCINSFINTKFIIYYIYFL